MWCTPFQFQSPCSIMVVGPSSCGKTVFVENLMRERSHLFSPPYNPVVYCYGANQPTTFERMKKEQGIRFHEGIPDTPLLDTWYKNARGGILILDDLMREGSDDPRVLDLFTRESHHKGINVVYMTQDMFPKGKHAKTISRNAHYIVAFKNPRDQLAVRHLTQQAFPQDLKEVMGVYRDATERPYGYLLFDLHPNSSDEDRLKSNLLKGEGYTTVYRKGGITPSVCVQTGSDDSGGRRRKRKRATAI